MENSINHNSELHTVLKDLIDLKSKRDGKIFTIYQLAKAINMPHSILVKLMHSDPTKRVNNPRIDTLTKIIDFFKSDGFSISIDDLLFGQKEIDIHSQSIAQNYVERCIPTFSLDYKQSKLGVINIDLPEHHKNLIAFLSDEEINPFFKSGSIFIVDQDIKPENDNLVIVKIEKYNKIVINKLIIDGKKRYLISLDNPTEKMPLLPTSNYQMIGVVVQINAKT